MLLSDIEKFTDYVPTAAGSDLNALLPFMEESELWMQDNLLGADLFVLIAGLEETALIKRHVQTAVCLKAYETAIPFLDLVQTPNGFGVVNNTNQAPASRERVERLLDSVARRLTTVPDSVINQIRADGDLLPVWKTSTASVSRAEIVFLTAAELRNFSGNKQADYHDLEASHPLILGFQAEVAKHISAGCLETLLLKRCLGTLSSREERAFRAIQTVIGLKMQSRPDYPLIEGLINYMISFPEEFPEYINSPEYRVKVSPKYENKKEHSTFFFG
jgi:hypothetical protein